MRISDWSSDVCSSDLGYVYITRGTLALANNEAEAAGVLGHEIGHVISHHAEKRYDKSVFTNLGVAGASILGSIFLGSGAGDLIEIGRASCRERVCQYV